MGVVNVSHAASASPKLDQKLEGIPEDIGQFVLKRFHATVFAQELIKEKIHPAAPTRTLFTRLWDHFVGPIEEDQSEGGQIEEGTYAGTQLALTEMYDRIEHAYGAWFDTIGIEPTIPQAISLKEKAMRYQWTTRNGFPPHLASIPKKKQASEWTIFNKMGLVGTATLLPKIVPNKQFLGSVSQWLYKRGNDVIHGTEYEGLTIADIEEGNRQNRRSGTDVMRGDDIGLKSDWWSDARFAQQQFTGANPTTITQASTDWIQAFKDAADTQDYSAASDTIAAAGSNSLFVQNCSYFRVAVGAGDADVLISKTPDADDKYECASVTLFELHPDGKLHPLAIVIDWKGTMEKSVVIFNKRLQPHDPLYAEPLEAEKNDWPWRYAKTCAQTSDWIRHEMAIHLVHTHLVEEVIIVAANRSFPSEHPVFRLLEPHWFRTLSLNAAARDTLVPDIIIDLVGISKPQAMSFINYAFTTFDFCGKYIPNDLPNRGFPLEELDSPRFKNYAYARNMVLMWPAIRGFVASMIDIDYAPEAVDGPKKGARKFVSEDRCILAWCSEIQSPNGGRLSSFPKIQTRDQLIDAITMCIHIASPQHTAVNYLQNFYQSFVIAKPPALYTPPPTDIQSLQAFTESDLIKALPIGRQRDWLLAAQVPWLLSFRVADDYNLITYAVSIWSVYKRKTGVKEVLVAKYASEFYSELKRLIGEFARHSGEMDEGSIPYVVMDPGCTAVSILI